MATIGVPETVEWLLDFVNLGCVPGELDLKRQLRYYIPGRPDGGLLKTGMRVKNILAKKGLIKRPPIEPSVVPVNFLTKFVGVVPKEKKNMGKMSKKTKKGAQVFHVNPEGEVTVGGKAEYYPKFFSGQGLPPAKKPFGNLYLKGNMEAIVPKDIDGRILRFAKIEGTGGVELSFERHEAYYYLKLFSQVVLYFLWDIELKGAADDIITPNSYIIDIKTPINFCIIGHRYKIITYLRRQ